MSRYAEGTNVPVAKSRAEIESIVTRYGAQRFASMLEHGRALIMFEANQRRICFELPLPHQSAFKVRKVNTSHGHFREVERSGIEIEKAWEQACRQRWRALALVIKAKLEAVEAGISEFEDEFLSHIVMPNGKTVGRWLKPQLAEVYETQKMPPMLTAGDGR